MHDLNDLAEAFTRQWEADAAPDLDTFLARGGPVGTKLLAQLARIDQAYQWRSGDRRLAENYLDRFPALHADPDSAVDLIYHEYLLREKLAEQPSVEEFARRFPQHAAAIADQVGLHRVLIEIVENESLLPSFGPRRAEVDRVAQVTCPVCHNVIRQDNVGPEEELICLSCGSRFRIQRDVALDWRPSAQSRQLGKYELLEPVGVGSFCTVYKARDHELDRTVAIKVPRASHLAEDDLQRFQREARSVAQLRHPSIVSVYEIGQWDKTPFLVSEFVQGATLADRLSVRRPAPREAAELVATVADALHYAHEMGVVHRDVKPANIMLDEQGTPRLMDFGLARRDAGDVTMTMDGQVLGTPAYMSPEQARGESRKVDGRSDVYALGVILYQLLTGELPFRGTTQMLLHQVLHDEPRRPRSLSHLVPNDLETICLKAMAKEAGRRYATAREFADDLRRFMQGEPIYARPVNGVERAWLWCRRKPALAALTAVVGILLIAIAAGGTAVVSILFMAIATGGTVAAFQFRRQAQKEHLLREEADENLYYHRIALAHRDLTANLPNPGRADSLLEACPVRHRNWEWYYLKRLWRTEPVVLSDPSGNEFNSVSFSHDGTQLAAGCADGTVRVWDLNTYESVTLHGHVGYVFSVAFHPLDNQRLVSTGADATVRVWDLTTKREAFAPLPGRRDAPANGKGTVYSVAYSPDGERLAAFSGERTVRIWDATTGQLMHELTDHTSRGSCVAFSSDSAIIATGDWPGTVRIWDVRTGRLLRTLEHGEFHPVGSLAFRPNAGSYQLAAGFYSGRVLVWNDAAGRPDRMLEHAGIINGLAFHPQGERLAASTEDRTVVIWDPHVGREILQLRGHTDFCRGLAFGPPDCQAMSDGSRLASTALDGTIRLWDATAIQADEGQERNIFNGAEYDLWSVAINPSGTLLAAAGAEPALRLWDPRTGALKATISDFTQVIFDLDFSADSRYLVAAGIDNDRPPFVVKVWDNQTYRAVAAIRVKGEVFATAFHPSGQWLALGFMDGAVRLASFGDAVPPLIIPLGQHDSDLVMRGVSFRRDGQRLASASRDGVVKVWDVARVLSGELLRGKSAANAESRVADFLPLAECQLKPCVALWSVAYSPDGRHIITGSIDGQLTRWDAETGQRLENRTEASRGGFLSVACSPDGRWIVSVGEDCTVRVYDATSLEFVRRFRGHLGPIHCLAVSDDLIVTGSADQTVRVWDLSAVGR